MTHEELELLKRATKALETIAVELMSYSVQSDESYSVQSDEEETESLEKPTPKLDYGGGSL